MDFAKKTFSIFKMDVGVHGVTFFLKLGLASLLGPYDYGLFSLIMLIPDYSEKLGRFGIDDAAVYWAGKKKYPFGEIAVNLGFVTVLLSLIPIMLFIWRGDLFSRWILKDNSIDNAWLWIVLVNIPFFLLTRSISKLLLFKEEIAAYNYITFLPSLCGLIFGVGGIIIFKTGLLTVLLGYTVIYVLTGIIGGYLILRRSSAAFSFRFDLIKDLFDYGLRMYVPNIVQFLHYRIDVLLVAYFLTPKEVGYYTVAVSIVEIMRKLPGAVSYLLYTRVTRLEREKSVHLTLKSIRHVLAILALSTVPFYYSIKLVIVYFMNAYLPILTPLLMLLPSMLAVGVSQLLIIHFFGIGNPFIVLMSVATGLLLNITLNIIWIPSLGIFGAALASAISYGVSSIMLINVLMSMHKVGLKNILIFNNEDLDLYKKLLNMNILKGFLK